MSSPTKRRDAGKDATPDVACKQSTSSVLDPSVSSVQKYKYMLSLLFFFSLFLFLFVHISRTYWTKKKTQRVCRNAPVLRRLCWSLPIFAALCPAPFHPDVAGWCGFVVGCLLDGFFLFCINNKGFSTVRGHWSQQVSKKKKKEQTPKAQVSVTAATADPSWVCNGAGGGISGGGKHKLNISSHLWAVFFIPSPRTQDGGRNLRRSAPHGGKIISFEFLKVCFPTAVNGFEHISPPCFDFKAAKCPERFLKVRTRRKCFGFTAKSACRIK